MKKGTLQFVTSICISIILYMIAFHFTETEIIESERIKNTIDNYNTSTNYSNFLNNDNLNFTNNIIKTENSNNFINKFLENNSTKIISGNPVIDIGANIEKGLNMPQLAMINEIKLILKDNKNNGLNNELNEIKKNDLNIKNKEIKFHYKRLLLIFVLMFVSLGLFMFVVYLNNSRCSKNNYFDEDIKYDLII